MWCRRLCVPCASLRQQSQAWSTTIAVSSRRRLTSHATRATPPRRRVTTTAATTTTSTTTTVARRARRCVGQQTQAPQQQQQPLTCKHTPGACVDVSYFTGVHASRWTTHFAQAHLQHKQPTAPRQACPFCFAAAQQQQQQQQQEQHVAHEQSALTTSSSSSLVCVDAAPTTMWYTPCEMVRHMSWRHAPQGYRPQELHAYNTHVIDALLARLCGRSRGRTDDADKGSDRNSSSSEARSSAVCAPFRLLLLLDVANVELGVSDLMLGLLQSAEARRLFAAVPVAVCCVLELFLPHTAKTLHAAYQLAQLHRHSDMYTLYSVSRLEAGDLACAALVGALQLRAPRQCPPVVLLTMDGQQRTCMIDLYGTAAVTTSPFGAVHAIRPTSVSALLRKLAMALEYGMHAV